MIKKVLVANRGEIALRVIRACKELGIKTVSVHSTADENSLHRFFSDEDVCIGEPSSTDSYLNIPRIIAAVEITGADAVHPGYGFLSENASFSEACEANKINFIGPKKDVILKMGNKSTAREAVKKAGVPIVPGTGILTSKAEAVLQANKIKYPVILKASAGGGGKGMRICWDKVELKENFDLAKNESAVNFGNSDIYLEKYIEQPHHIEVQILGDQYGKILHLGERDCSIQRRHQKLIEETPSSFINSKIRKKIADAAIKVAQEASYVGAGTVEFLVDKHMNFYFIEMNTRIQVEHTISELYTGIDLVKYQIKVANGEKIPYTQNQINFRGHVIECRINAEDPYNNFSPQPGKITRYHLPQGLGVRIDSHCYTNYEIPPHYDSLIAKLIVWGIDREEAINRMKRSLDEFIVEGVPTTIPFNFAVMNDKNFTTGDFGTDFLDNFTL